ncbi:MAG: S4 domain-containing protein [Gemmatimonadota bacterium]|nr:S4 domain-containing protein [Gemmatimonadota bacterium]
MRLDLALKRLLLVKSRTDAKEACDVGSVWVNGKPAKASLDVKTGDRIRIEFAERNLEIELTGDVGKNVSRAEAKSLYRITSEESVHDV